MLLSFTFTFETKDDELSLTVQISPFLCLARFYIIIFLCTNIKFPLGYVNTKYGSHVNAKIMPIKEFSAFDYR